MFFDDKNNEYVIKDMYPRRPLINYLWNEDVVWSLNQFGCGKSLAGIGSVRRTMATGERLIYVKLQDGTYYAANRNFKKESFDVFETHVGLGYHRVIGEYKGIRTETTFFLSESGYVDCENISVENKTDRELFLHIYVYLEPYVNTSGHTSYSRAGKSKKYEGITLTHNGYALPHDYNTIYVSADRKIDAFEVTKGKFTGVYSTLSDPDGLQKDLLSCEGATFEDDFICALQFSLRIPARKKENINVCLAIGKTEEEAHDAAIRICSQESYKKALQYQKTLHNNYNSVFTVSSDDEYFNRLTNVWLKRQVALGKTWGRVYGRGFRDVMQDICGFVSLDVSLAKKRILYALKHQFINGNTIRMFDPIFDEPYNDGASWIPATILHYLKESGDFSILQERVGYFDSDATDTVFDHMKRGMEYLTTCLGKHGLVLWFGGDWNDSLNNCGRKGIGESVWLSIATVKAVKEFLEITDRLGFDFSYMKVRADILTENIYKYGFEGDRFIYGYNDYGEKIGSVESEQAKIYLNPQSWAILAGIVSEDTANRIWTTVDKTLKCAFGYKQCNPSYHCGSDRIGRASYFVEGLVENGAVYNHGVTFKIMADCIKGDGNSAYNDFKLISPLNPKNKNNGMEEYAISNMYIGDECPYKDIVGYAPMSWITGTAGWLYRNLTEGILGISADFEGLRVTPRLPDEWNRVDITRRFRGAKYEITILRGVGQSTMDGKPFSGNLLGYNGKNHRVTLYLQ